MLRTCYRFSGIIYMTNKYLKNTHVHNMKRCFQSITYRQSHRKRAEIRMDTLKKRLIQWPIKTKWCL